MTSNVDWPVYISTTCIYDIDIRYTCMYHANQVTGCMSNLLNVKLALCQPVTLLTGNLISLGNMLILKGIKPVELLSPGRRQNFENGMSLTIYAACTLCDRASLLYLTTLCYIVWVAKTAVRSTCMQVHLLAATQDDILLSTLVSVHSVANDLLNEALWWDN